MRAVAVPAISVTALGCTIVEGKDVEIPTWEEFRARVPRDPHGALIADGHIPFWSEATLRAHYDAYVASVRSYGGRNGIGVQRQGLIINTVDGSDDRWFFPDNFRLTYCVSAEFGSRFSTVVTNMREATQSWSALAAVEYQYMPQDHCDMNNNNVVFNVSPIVSDAYFARSFTPRLPRHQREFLITAAAFTTTQGDRDFQGILRHELGHTLGFRHEQDRLDPPCMFGSEGECRPNPCDGDPSPEQVSVVESFRELTEYDEYSVMHYPECRSPQGGGYRQTELDAIGAAMVYGTSPYEVVLASLLAGTT